MDNGKPRVYSEKSFEKAVNYLNGKYKDSGIPKPQVLRADEDDQLRQDGWGNVVRSVGSRLQRAGNLSSGQTWARLPFETCENFYSSNAIARKAVRLILDYGLLNGWRFQFEGLGKEGNLKAEEEIRENIEKPLNIIKETNQAIEWGRLYGSAYLLGNFEDGRHPSEPLDLTNIKNIEWLQALTPFELFPLKKNYTLGSQYLEPEHYTFVGYGGYHSLSGLQVHKSRIIRFNGIYLPRQQYISNSYIHNSVLQPIYDVFQDYGLALEACGYAIREYSQPVYKIKGLSTMLNSGRAGESNIITRMQAVESVRNLTRTVIMDADKESYDRVAGRFSGISEIVGKLEKQMVAVSNVPHNLLFSEAAGHAKASFSSNGQSEWGEWETTVHSFRKNYIIEPLERLYSLLFLNKNSGMKQAGKLPKFNIKFSGQRKLGEDKEVELYQKLLEADSLAVEQGFLTPEEVRNTRYSQGGTFSDYSTRVELDEDAYKEVQEEKKKQAEGFKPGGEEGEEESGEAQEGEEKDPKQKKERGDGVIKRFFKRGKTKFILKD